jgi:Zn-dependent peptidase ImmA (M78 family)
MTRLGIENLAKEVLKAVGVAPTPPIPVRLVAERLGVSDISTRPMGEDGALVRLGTVTKVLLREGRSPTRQRFTLAHELAHLLLLGDTELALEFRQVRRERDAEESLGDDRPYSCRPNGFGRDSPTTR